jgi:hypothetical protein
MIRLATLVLLAGCSSFIDNKAADSTLKILAKSTEAAARESDIALARDAMPGGLFQLEAFALAYPDHPAFREMHTDALCQYATGFVYDDWEEASLTGKDAAPIADRLVPLLERCAAANRARLPATWTVETTTRAQVPAVLWLASVGAVQLALSPMAHLAEIPQIQAMLARCATLQPGFRDAGAETLIAVLIASRAQMFGGPDGTAEFARARALAPYALLVDVMFGRTRRTRPELEAALTAALAVDLAKWPEHRLVNELARKKAKRYLAAAATLLRE